jgi:hypothetical protein
MDLLSNVLKTVCDLANSNLKNIDPRPDAWVVLTSLVDHDGSVNQAARDKIVMTVYNISRETFSSSYQAVTPVWPGADLSKGLPVTSPPLYLDVHLMFMANFAERNYLDGLSALSRLISFFQQNPVFTPQNAPSLAPVIDKISLDFENMDDIDVNYVMGVLGTRYFPSAFYKLRLIPFASTAMLERTYAVTASDVATGSSAGGSA